METLNNYRRNIKFEGKGAHRQRACREWMWWLCQAIRQCARDSENMSAMPMQKPTHWQHCWTWLLLMNVQNLRNSIYLQKFMNLINLFSLQNLQNLKNLENLLNLRNVLLNLRSSAEFAEFCWICGVLLNFAEFAEFCWICGVLLNFAEFAEHHAPCTCCWVCWFCWDCCVLWILAGLVGVANLLNLQAVKHKHIEDQDLHNINRNLLHPSMHQTHPASTSQLNSVHPAHSHFSLINKQITAGWRHRRKNAH